MSRFQFKAYPVKVLTNVIAPYQHTLTLRHVREIVNKKYGGLKFFNNEEPANKLDKAFDRWVIGGVYKPVLYGNTIYSAIKRALGLSGKKPLQISVQYAVFDEDDVGLYVYNIVVKGKQTLVQYEVLRSGAEGAVVGNLERLKEIVKNADKIVIQIGSHRNHGFGLMEIKLT